MFSFNFRVILSVANTCIISRTSYISMFSDVNCLSAMVFIE